MAGSTGAVQTIDVTAAARGVYDFRFDGYSITIDVTDDDGFYQTEPFSVGGHNWAIRYYPTNYQDGWVCLYPTLLSKPEDDGPVHAAGQAPRAVSDR
uniref:MATH domain-containing protein n=1 Tax=Leersia perrieri TaxID=77586 RepID=A0A0D9V0Q4_9ORYZ